MRKFLKRILYFIVITCLLFFSFIFGKKYEKKQQEQLSNQLENIATIAVVNMDEGIQTKEGNIKYASQLINFPNENFVITGLNDAKQGTNNGIYAAYIVIPETFSESIESIKNAPQKIFLEYEYNDKLTAETKIETINNVNSFVTSFNSNISYMYVDAILTEFHNVQDDSSVILANDDNELQQMQGINPVELIATVETVEETSIEMNIEELDLEPYYVENENILNSLFTDYETASKSGMDDFTVVKSAGIKVQEAFDDFFLLYEDAINDTQVNNAEILEIGQNNLSDAVGVYNDDIASKKDEVKAYFDYIVEQQRLADEISAQQQVNRILEDINSDEQSKIFNLQEKWKSTLSDVKTYAQTNVDDLNTVLLAEYQSDVDTEIETIILEAYKSGAKDALEALEDSLVEDETEEETETGDETETADETDSEEIIEVETTYTLTEIQEASADYIDNNLSGDASSYFENATTITLSSEKLGNVIIDWNSADIVYPDPSTLDEEIEAEKNDCNEETGENEDDAEDSADENEEDKENNEEQVDDGEDTTIVLTTCQSADEVQIDILSDAVVNIFTLEDDKSTITDIIQTNFKDAILQESLSQLGRLAESEEILSEEMTSYEEALCEFDPYTYIESKNLSSYLNDIKSNSDKLLGIVRINNQEYVLYASDVCVATSENISNLKSALSSADLQTASNVETCIDDLILSRESINEQNVAMLQNFSTLLPYTRVESLKNTEVYDYIVSPVEPLEIGYIVVDPIEEINKTNFTAKDIIVFILFIAIAIFVVSIIVTIKRYREIKRDTDNL